MLFQISCQFSITCKNWMHKVSELLSKINNLSSKVHTHTPPPDTHTHATQTEKPLKILGIREEKATVNIFPPYIQNIFICIIHLTIYLFFFLKNYVSGTQLSHRARIILRLCTPIAVSRVPCIMTAPHDHCMHLTRQTMV